MAVVMGFRVAVDASKFFTDIKKNIFIYVDLLRDRTIEDIENHIRTVLQIKDKVGLVNGKFYLPSCENVRVLCSGDHLKVVDPNEDVSSHITELIVQENESSVKVKKKRKKNYKQDTSENEVLVIHVDQEDLEAVQFDGRVKDGLLRKNKEENVDVSPKKVTEDEEEDKCDTDTSGKEIRNGYENKEEKSRKESQDNNFASGDISITLDETIEPPKKRHRTRVRKRKNRQSVKPFTISNLPLKFSSPKEPLKRSHIRFSDNTENEILSPEETVVNQIPGSLQPDVKMTETVSNKTYENGMKAGETVSKKTYENDIKTHEAFSFSDDVEYGITGTKFRKWDVKSEYSDNPNGGPTIGETFSKLLSLGKSSTPLVYERKSAFKGNLEEYPKILSFPKAGDFLGFKILRMDENYTPKVSGYITAKVVKACDSTYELELSVISGQAECRRPKGKFDLEEASELPSGESNDILKVNWNELIETRLIYP